MNDKKIKKRNFTFMADYGGAWGWQTDYYDDGATDYCCCIAEDLTTEIDNGVEVAELDAELSNEIEQWQHNFEVNSLYNPDFEWDKFNKQGGKLFKKLEQQIGHLFDEMTYDVPFEYITYLKEGMAIP